VASRHAYAEQFTNDALAAVGGNLLGAILFGSVARGTEHDTSDIDLLFVVSSLHRDAAADIVTALARAAREYPLAANCDSYERLRHFAELGDPFVRTIFAEGEILHDTNQLLARLSEACRDPQRVPDKAAAARQLHTKALFHHRRVHEHLDELLGDVQLSLMARAQAIALLAESSPAPETFVAISTWPGLESVLRDRGIDGTIAEEARALVAAYKQPFSTEVLADFRQRLSDVAEQLERAYDALQGEKKEAG